MPINNFLIIGVSPANNQANVEITAPIQIHLAKHLRIDTVTEANVVFRKINGDDVDYTVEYSGKDMTIKILPEEVLEEASDYEIFIRGGETSILSITNDYLGDSRIYRFSTGYNIGLSAPESLKHSIDNRFITLKWERPSEFDHSLPLRYEVMVSVSNEPEDAPVWPGQGDVNQTGKLEFAVPKKFTPGSYYGYVRAIDAHTESEWARVQLLVEEAEVPTSPLEPGGNTGFGFEITDAYPKDGAVDTTPEKILLMFSADIDPETVDENSVYVLKKEKRSGLSPLELMTSYAPSKQIPATIEEMPAPNILAIQVDLEKDTEYLVVVRERIASTEGEKLGVAETISFMTKFSHLYGDAEMVKSDVGAFLSNLTDRILYKMMRDASIHAYSTVSQTANFTPGEYEDGKAPYAIHQYVRHKTAYELLVKGYMQASSGAGSSVTLGDLSIDKKSSQNDITSLLKELKERIKPWEDAIHGLSNRGYAKPTVAVRGENIETYPDFLTRTEFVELGQ